MAAQGRIALNPEARRMALSMRRLMRHIEKRDLKLTTSGRAGLIIFPTTDANLQAALVLVADRLDLITPRIGVPLGQA